MTSQFHLHLGSPARPGPPRPAPATSVPPGPGVWATASRTPALLEKPPSAPSCTACTSYRPFTHHSEPAAKEDDGDLAVRPGSGRREGQGQRNTTEPERLRAHPPDCNQTNPETCSTQPKPRCLKTPTHLKLRGALQRKLADLEEPQLSCNPKGNPQASVVPSARSLPPAPRLAVLASLLCLPCCRGPACQESSTCQVNKNPCQNHAKITNTLEITKTAPRTLAKTDAKGFKPACKTHAKIAIAEKTSAL